MKHSTGWIVALAFGALPALAEDAAPACEKKGENGMVTMLLCPEGLSQEQMAAEGRAACGDRKPCGAWIWDDAAAIPPEAPDSHDKLPKESVRAALAIWVNETDQLVTVSKQAKN